MLKKHILLNVITLDSTYNCNYNAKYDFIDALNYIFKFLRIYAKSVMQTLFLTIIHIIYICIAQYILQSQSQANFYSDCILSFQLSGSNAGEEFSISGVNNSCFQDCQVSCSVFSTMDPKTKQEYNSDVILQCISACQQGAAFTSDYLILKQPQIQISAKDTDGSTVTKTTTVNTLIYTGTPRSSLIVPSCIIDSTNISTTNENVDVSTQASSAYKVLSTISKGDVVLVSLNDNAAGNKIAMCGKRSLKIDPVFPDMYSMNPDIVTGGNAAFLNNTSSSNDSVTNEKQYYNYSAGGLQKAHIQQMQSSWNDTSTPPLEWPDLSSSSSTAAQGDNIKFKMLHPCLSSISDTDWQNMSNASLLSGNNRCIDVKSFAETALKGKSNSCDYNIVEMSFCNYDKPLNIGECLFSQVNGIYFCSLIGYPGNDPDQCNNDLQNFLTIAQDPKASIYPANVTSDVQNLSKPPNSNCFWDWHVRNTQFTDTGIYVGDGDELSITWSGDLLVNTNSTQYNNNQYVDHKNSFMCYITNNIIIQDPTFAIGAGMVCQDHLMNSSKLLTNFGDLVGERARTTSKEVCEGGKDIGGKHYTSLMPPESKLEKSLTSLSLSDSSIQLNPDMPSDSKHIPCMNILDPGLTKYTYSGILSDIASERTSLKIQHSNNYQYDGKQISDKALGGTQVLIDWSGCPIFNGESLLYGFAIIDKSKGRSYTIIDDVISWQPLIFNGSNTATINTSTNIVNSNNTTTDTNNTSQSVSNNAQTAQSKLFPDTVKDGQKIDLYFKLDDSKFKDISSSNPKIQALYASGNRIGSYNLSLSKQGDNPAYYDSNGIFKHIAQTFNKVFFGDVNQFSSEYGTKGAVGTIFTSLTQKDPRYHTIIIVMMVLYISILSISFMSGIIEIKQQDLVYRALKLGVIATLISPMSWQLFGSTLLSLCVVAPVQLIAIFTSGTMPFSTMQIDLAQDPYAIFNAFDGPIKILGSSIIWDKIEALIFTGLVGFVLVIVIIFALLAYVLAIIKAAMIYIFCTMAIGLLITLGPIFIPMLLFENTRSLFNDWVKNLISYSLQPVVVFASIALFNLLIITLIYITFNFSICKFCFINIPIVNYCLWDVWRSLAFMHYPAVDGIMDFFLPNGLIASSLAFAILGLAVLEFTDFACNIVSKMTTFQAGKNTDSAMSTSAMIRDTGNMLKLGARKVAEPIAKGVIRGTEIIKADWKEAFKDKDQGLQEQNQNIKDHQTATERLTKLNELWNSNKYMMHASPQAREKLAKDIKNAQEAKRLSELKIQEAQIREAKLQEAQKKQQEQQQAQQVNVNKEKQEVERQTKLEAVQQKHNAEAQKQEEQVQRQSSEDAPQSVETVHAELVKQIENLTPDERAKLAQDLVQSAQENMMNQMMSKLSPEAQVEHAKALESIKNLSTDEKAKLEQTLMKSTKEIHAKLTEQMVNNLSPEDRQALNKNLEKHSEEAQRIQNLSLEEKVKLEQNLTQNLTQSIQSTHSELIKQTVKELNPEDIIKLQQNLDKRIELVKKR